MLKNFPHPLWPHIRKYPAMYLGEVSLTALLHYVSGWRSATHAYEIEDIALPMPKDINVWVSYRLGLVPSARDWCKMILSREPDEVKAFELFFQFMDEHAVREGVQIAYHPSVTTTFREGDDSRWTTQTSRISLISYTLDKGFFVHYEPDLICNYDGPEFYPSLNWLENITGYSFDELVITDPVRFAQVAFLNPEDENYGE